MTLSSLNNQHGALSLKKPLRMSNGGLPLRPSFNYIYAREPGKTVIVRLPAYQDLLNICKSKNPLFCASPYCIGEAHCPGRQTLVVRSTTRARGPSARRQPGATQPVDSIP